MQRTLETQLLHLLQKLPLVLEEGRVPLAEATLAIPHQHLPVLL
jgi:hypothetical protein